jgi:hypothetical protein
VGDERAAAVEDGGGDFVAAGVGGEDDAADLRRANFVLGVEEGGDFGEEVAEGVLVEFELAAAGVGGVFGPLGDDEDGVDLRVGKLLDELVLRDGLGDVIVVAVEVDDEIDGVDGGVAGGNEEADGRIGVMVLGGIALAVRGEALLAGGVGVRCVREGVKDQLPSMPKLFTDLASSRLTPAWVGQEKAASLGFHSPPSMRVRNVLKLGVSVLSVT